MSEQERRVVVPGGELAVFDHGGSGPDVLLVHSVCHSSPVWDDVIAALGGQARLVTVDLRGHGHSTAPAGDVDEIPADLVRVVEALELRRPVLVGHDVGDDGRERHAQCFRNLPELFIVGDCIELKDASEGAIRHSRFDSQ